MRLITSIYTVGFLVLVSISPAQGATKCDFVFSGSKRTVAEHVRLFDELIATEAALYERKDVVQTSNKLTSIFGNSTGPNQKRFFLEAKRILSDFSNPLFQDFVLRLVAKNRELSTDFKSLTEAIEDSLQPFWSAEQAQKRREDFFSGKSSLEEMIGNLTHDQMLVHLVGPNPSRISPSSLLGRYLQEVNAVRGEVALELRALPKAQGLGEPRWLIALDSKTFPIYKKYFFDSHFFTHTHSSGQGTLYVAHNGKVTNWTEANKPQRVPSEDTLLPSILLSSAEANRMRIFFEMAERQHSAAKFPWTLGKLDEATSEFRAYSAKGFFTCCTHWIGNIPLGEKTTARYVFPKQDDGRAGAQKALTEYDSFAPSAEYNDRIDSSQVEPVHPYTKLAWTVPGHQQLWEVLGLRQAQVSGELANPGFVAHALIAKADPSRVPFVFIMTPDARQPLPQNAQIRSSIDPH